MSMKHGVSAKPFFVRDRYAEIALGPRYEPGGSLSDVEITVGARGLSHTVIPDIDEDVLTVVGDQEEQVAAVADVLLSRWSRRKLWNQPTLPMELQAYVAQLLEAGEIFIHLLFERSPETGQHSLFKTRWLPTETIVAREGPPITYEQFVSWRAYGGGPGYSVAGDPVDHFHVFSQHEVLHLRWPLPEPGGRAPAEAALRIGRRVERAANREILKVRSSAEPSEAYLSLARARAGAYGDALALQKRLSARISDMLFYPGADEAEMYPWAEPVTDFFAADRILRGRVAIAQVRDCLFREFNRQVIGPWVQLNNWQEIRLELRPKLLAADEWAAMRDELHTGTVDLEDVRAVVHAEAETVRGFNARWSQR
jgi:hypothetical protein